ncbi:MAG: acetoacetate--CoA ligase [Austwickia sp.]|jgi:acetoacetyl-CoA synthetase|nr:MAG: acetoacetate--CoA ligase [Austwickia sp.]
MTTPPASEPTPVDAHALDADIEAYDVEPFMRPDPAAVAESRLAKFTAMVNERHGLGLSTYDDLQAWSVRDLDGFWRAVWDFFDVVAEGSPDTVLAQDRMPGAVWFPDVRLNYAENLLRWADDPALADEVVVTSIDEEDVRVTATWRELRAQVAAFAAWLRSVGVEPGDRVIGYVPNELRALVAFLGSAAIGAVWSACGQDYSAEGAAARFGQLEPVVLVTADGYRWNGKVMDRRAEVDRLAAALPTLRAVVAMPHLGLGPETSAPGGAPGAPDVPRVSWDEAMASAATGATGAPQGPDYARLPFDAPLWILFSSGTTGKPKGIVHSHGGVLLELLKMLGLHMEMGPGRGLFWYTTTNWMLWNIVASAPLAGAPTVMYDGSPSYPDPMRPWRIIAEHRVAVAGLSPAFLLSCEKAGLNPGEGLNFDALRVVGVTGAPLPASPYPWIRDHVGAHVRVYSMSGGTDVATSFTGGAINTPIWAGELPRPMLGVALQSWDGQGQPVVGQVGELVITRPMPSMPLYFWADPDGARYHDAYFDHFPGVWRHGDWMEVTGRGSLIVSGRSDSTLNRHGVRLGSADIYEVVDTLPDVAESLVIGAELDGGGYWLVLFVVPAEGVTFDDSTAAAIKSAIRDGASPRHVPDDVIAVASLPHTKTGKKLEVPVKRLIQGHPLESVAAPDAVDDYASLTQFQRYVGGKRDA